MATKRAAKRKNSGSASKTNSRPRNLSAAADVAAEAGFLPADAAQKARRVSALMGALGEPGSRPRVVTNLGPVLVDQEPSLGTAELCLRWFEEVKMRQQEQVQRELTIKLGRLAMHVDSLQADGAPAWPSLRGGGDLYAAFKARVQAAKGLSEVDYLRVAGLCFSLILAGQEGKA